MCPPLTTWRSISGFKTPSHRAEDGSAPQDDANRGSATASDYIFALAFGVVFQYFAIAPMRGLGLKDGLMAAAKADFISLTAFEVGPRPSA